MTITINHPRRRRSIPMLPAFVGLAMAALVMAVAFQLSGAFGSNEPAPPAPAIEAPTINQGPNVGLPQNSASQQASSPGTVGGPNADLAPDRISQGAAAAASVGDSVNLGPNVGLPRDWATNPASVVTQSAQGPNAGLAPDWTTRQPATVLQD